MEYGTRKVYQVECEGEYAQIVAVSETDAETIVIESCFGDESDLLTAREIDPAKEIVVTYDDEATAVADAKRIGAAVVAMRSYPSRWRIRAQACKWALLDGGAVLTCSVS